jgi:hypothetical protein
MMVYLRLSDEVMTAILDFDSYEIVDEMDPDNRINGMDRASGAA